MTFDEPDPRPRCRTPSRRPRESRDVPPAAPLGDTLRVLIVDDEESVAHVYAAYARVRGHSATVAHDGAEALVVATHEQPDAIVLDVAMPKLDGRDVCRALRDDPRTAHIPVVVVSAHGDDPFLRDVLIRLGVFDVQTKPVDLPALFRRLERAVAHARESAHEHDQRHGDTDATDCHEPDR